MKPNFLIIGAARSATTSMFKYLEAHPDVFLSQIKEINFFSNPKFWNKGFDWYLSHFADANNKAVGEASTSYSACTSDDDTVPMRIKKHLGKVKLVYILRDPIDRILSHYAHYIDRGVRNEPIEQLLSSDTYLDSRWQGRYWHQLQQYLKHYERDDILIITVNELANMPQKVMDKVYAHIGVDSLDLHDQITQVHNASSQSTEKTAFGLAVLDFYHKHIEQKRIPYSIKKLFPKLAEVGAKPITKQQLQGEDYDALKAFYADDVKKLENDFAVDISSWKNFSVDRAKAS